MQGRALSRVVMSWLALSQRLDDDDVFGQTSSDVYGKLHF
jgi:hypothetical protein